METLVECWLEDTRVRAVTGINACLTAYKLRGSDGNAAFELVDLLTSSAQNAVHMLCESIAMRSTPASERVRRMAVNPNVYVNGHGYYHSSYFLSTDFIIFLFLEDYLSRLEGPIATQVWNRFVSLAKDIAANVYTYKMQILPTLRSVSSVVRPLKTHSLVRCLTAISEIVTQTTAIEDKKVRKDLQVGSCSYAAKVSHGSKGNLREIG